MTSGIYLITNNINGHEYVGGSIDIERRFSEHKRGIQADKQAIDRAILKYGKENFTYQIITELPADWNIIDKHERYWIKFYNTFKTRKHYNLTEGGEGITGWHHTEEAKQKMSESHTGKTLSEEHKRKIGEGNKDKTVSEETKQKLSEINSGENHPMWNKHHTEESKQKMSESKSGKNNPQWKDYPRIIKDGVRNKKQIYCIRYNGKRLKQSVSVEKLEEWFKDNYPKVELIKEA